MYSNTIETSVVIPVLNEKNYIKDCLRTIIKQDYPKENLEVLFVDGNSTDGTRQILKSATEQYSWIRLLDNKRKIIPSAMNIGILAAKGIYIVRMDAHTQYSFDYISKCIETIKKTNADNVGGPVIAKGKTKTQRAVAAAYYSIFALGGGDQYKENYEGEVDTVFLGCYKREYAISIGLYDENMPRNEDDEFNYRIIKNKGRVYMTPSIRTEYYPRDSIIALAKQYYYYGEGKPTVLKKHGKPARFRQIVPSLFVVFLLLGGIGSFLSIFIRVWYICGLLLYLLLDIWFSFTSTKIQHIDEKIRLLWIHFVIHVSYGWGYLKGLLNINIKKGKNCEQR